MLIRLEFSLLPFLALLLPTSSLETPPPTTLSTQLYAHPLPLSSPQPLALLTYTPGPPPTSPKITQFKPPLPVGKSALHRDDLVRIGVLNATSGMLATTNTIVRLDALRPVLSVKFRVRMRGGEVWGVDWVASEDVGLVVEEEVKGKRKDKKGKVAEKDEEAGPEVEIVRDVEAPRPILNRPVVLTQGGKVKQEEPEKSLLQR